MRRFKLFAALILALVATTALLGCGTTTLTGEVHFSLDGIPVEGATITIGEEKVTTDADGTFVLEELPREVLAGTAAFEGFPEVIFTVDLDGLSEKHTIVEIPVARAAFIFAENTYEPKDVTDVTVFIDDVELDENLQTGLLPMGMYTLRVESEIYEPFEQEIELLEGDVSKTIYLDLGARETYERFSEANKFGRFADSYNYIHPDQKELMSLDDWEGANDNDFTIVSIEFGGMRMLDTWDSIITGETYENVAAIDRTIVGEYQGFRLTDNATQHWIQYENGRWYMMHSERFW